MQKIGTMREFRTKNFTVIADAVEDGDLDLSFDDDGTVASGLESGKFIAFCARVRVFFQGEEIGSDYLGGCIYESLDAFMDHRECGRANREFESKGEAGRCGSYFMGMIHSAIGEARKHIADMKAVHIRA